MTTASFLLAAGGLAAVSLAPLAPALLRDSALPKARLSLAALALAVPLSAGLMYQQLGRPEALEATLPTVQATPPPVAAMVERLEARLRAQPDDAEGWALMARSRDALGQPDLALAAYAQLRRLRPADPAVLSQQAVTVAQARGQGLEGEPRQLLEQALQLDPRHAPALALLGAAALERGDRAAAIGYWNRVLALVPPDGDEAASLRDSIARAQRSN